MPVWMRASVDVAVTEDINFERSFFDDTWSVLDGASFAHGDGKSVDAPTGQTTTVDLQSIGTGGLLFVRSNRQVKVLLSNGADVDQAITVGPAPDQEGVMLLFGQWDTLKIQNNSGADARVLVGFAGNP